MGISRVVALNPDTDMPWPTHLPSVNVSPDLELRYISETYLMIMPHHGAF